MRTLTSVGAIVCALLTVPFSAVAQTGFVPLNEYLQLPTDRRVPSYPLVRCAAFYNGVVGYAGARMGDDVVKASREAATTLFGLAVLMRAQNERGQVDGIREETLKSFNLITDIYIDRMRRNFATRGEAFASDPLISGDMQLCKEIAEAASERVRGMR
jgi:hypothetical protein